MNSKQNNLISFIDSAEKINNISILVAIIKFPSIKLVSIKVIVALIQLSFLLLLSVFIEQNIFPPTEQVGGFNGRNINKIISEVFKRVGLISNRYLMSINACLPPSAHK